MSIQPNQSKLFLASPLDAIGQDDRGIRAELGRRLAQGVFDLRILHALLGWFNPDFPQANVGSGRLSAQDLDPHWVRGRILGRAALLIIEVSI